MKKTKKTFRPSKPSLPKALKRRPKAEDRMKEAFANVPKITNETLAEHREDVLKGARKFIYPLKHSRRRGIIISTTIFVAAIVIFMSYVSVSLYRLQSTDGFTYGVTKVIPFPVAKAGSSWVSYNSYLFQLRRYIHYYTTQQEADFSGKDKEQLSNYKQQALDQVINDAYVKQLAKKNDVRVTSRQVDAQVRVVQQQNRLGTSQREFREVLNEFWGWSEADFKRALQQEMLSQAVVAKLDTATNQRAASAETQLKNGGDFAAIAAQVSEDQTSKANSGRYQAAIDPNNTDISPIIVSKLRSMQPGQISGIINTGYTLEIVRLDAVQDGKLTASHIVFNYKSINDYIKPLKDSAQPRAFIGV